MNCNNPANGNVPTSSIFSLLFVLFGVVAVGMFHADLYFPIWLSVAVMIFVQLYFLQRYRQKRLGILLLLIWLVYALPFIHIPEYIWFDFNRDSPVFWILAVNPYMVDQRVIELTAMIGAVGSMGMALGAALNTRPIQQDYGLNHDGSKRVFRTMSMPIWLVWVAVGVALSALNAPQETIFSAAYTESKSTLDGANFSSAWMVSYIILTFVFCDALLERKSTIKFVKMVIILAAVVLVVVFFQLLRGDRESVPWVFSLALVYFYWAASITQRRGFKVPWLKLGGVVFGLAVTSMFVGVIRSGLVDASLSDAFALIGELDDSQANRLALAMHGTWSATLLTPLSVAGDHIYGLLAVKWGEDYLNLFLSIIPGFLADAIGYIRPIDGNHGPAWEMSYGIGGTHATVVPFMNFRMLGVFLVPAIWTFIMANFEKLAMRHISVIKLSLLVTIAMASPHWFWYGEKNGLNAIILWFLFSFFYLVSAPPEELSSKDDAKCLGGDRSSMKCYSE